MKSFHIILAVALITGGIFATSCSNEQTEETSATNETEMHEDHADHDHQGHENHDHSKAIAIGDYNLIPVKKSTEFPNAALEMKAPDASANIEAGPIAFEFDVKDYQLGSQTEGKMSGHCANSAKGQHIHWILNNDPYHAHYEANFTEELPDGKHLLLAFLSRSYHESIKNGKAYVVKQLNVGNVEGQEDYNLQEPMLFYSRPKGTYTGDDTKHLLLDFFLVNASLGADQYKVKVTINGASAVVDKWVPYLITGLPMGEHTVQIELMDAKGENAVSGPFNNSGPRTIVLEAAKEAS
jgi:hypothetical protein